MNLESLYHKINHPAELNAADIPALKELCAKYPYAQLFSVLYLKALAQSKDLHFEDELQNHAYKITDRAKLFDLINSHENPGPVENEPPTEKPLQAPPPVASRQETTESHAETIVPRPETGEEPIPAEAETESAAGEEDIAPHSGTREIDELEKEILSGVMATAYSLELEENKQDEEPGKVQDAATPKIDLHENRSFTSWLKLSSGKKEDGQPKKESDELVEKFIRQEPERMKPKTEFYSAPKKAKESISDDKLIYTETLANIYALQGNYPKAITAFQQLMLTIPEKKLYFAQKIEELNKKINS
ncbi:MAG: hypothetical protein ACO1O6_12085 [Bacteroidota bacterium]